MLLVAQGQRAVAAAVDVPDLDVRLAVAEVVLRRQVLADRAVAVVVVDGVDQQVLLVVVVLDAEQLEVADHLGREVLQDEAFILEGLHGELQGGQPVAAGDVREPAAVFLGGLLADAADVAVHGEAQRIGVDAAVVGAVEARLVDHAGVVLEELHHEAVVDQPLVIEVVDQRVVPEGRPALVHHLGLALRVEVLRHLAHDAHHLALPGLQQRRVLLDEVEDVFLRLAGVAGEGLFLVLAAGPGNGPPEIVDLALDQLLALLLALPFFLGGDRVGPLVAVDAVVHQRVAGVQQVFHRVDAVALLALHDVLLGEHQVIDDRTGVGPGAEQVVALEETVVPVAGVGDHQRLHALGVLFHEVGDARIGVDHDLVGQAHLTALVVLFRAEEVFAVRPVVIAEGHAYGGVGIHHLLGGDHLDLVGIGVQRVAFGDAADLAVVLADQVEGPFRTGGDRLALAHATSLLWNSSRNTG
ncbi:hypothetical protein D3C76_715540 [compost metagenome]